MPLNTQPQTHHSDLTVIIPRSNQQFAIPMLDTPQLDLVSVANPQQVLRLTTDANGDYSLRMRYRSGIDTRGVTNGIKHLETALKHAADIQDFSVTKDYDDRTGLPNLYLDPDGNGGLGIVSRSQFPVHLLTTLAHTPNPPRAHLIEAPDTIERQLFDEPAFRVSTRYPPDREWKQLRATAEGISPGLAALEFARIMGGAFWTSSMDTGFSTFVETLHDRPASASDMSTAAN